jgi:hypothetical protein
LDIQEELEQSHADVGAKTATPWLKRSPQRNKGSLGEIIGRGYGTEGLNRFSHERATLGIPMKIGGRYILCISACDVLAIGRLDLTIKSGRLTRRKE